MDISISTLLAALLPILATTVLFALVMTMALFLGVGSRAQGRRVRRQTSATSALHQ